MRPDLGGRTVRRRRLLTGLGAGAAGAAALVLVGCGGDDSNSTKSPVAGGATAGGATAGATTGPKRGGTVSVPFTQDTDQLDPHTNSFTALYPVSLSHASLTTFVPDKDPNAIKNGGYLAEKWEQVDETTLTFTLRQGVTFQDVAPVNGRAITADDVKFSLDRIRNGDAKFTRRAQLGSIDSIEVIDPKTVKIKTKTADASLLTYLSQVWMAVVPQEVVADLGTKAIGAGPYVMTKFEHNVGFEFKRNDKWWLPGQPYLDTIQVPVIPDPASRLAALRGGQIDILTDIALNDQDAIAADKNLTFVTFGQPSFQYIRFNIKNKSFEDVRIRRAFSLALDRQGIVQTAFFGKGKPSGSLPWPLPWALPPEQLNNYKQDIAQAKQLLEAAGVTKNTKFKHITIGGAGQQQDMTAAVLDQLGRNLGIQIDNQVLEYNAYLAAVARAEFDFNVHWGLSYEEIDGYMQEFLTKGGRNYGGWGSVELDQKLIAQRAMLDTDKRKAAIAEIQKDIADQMWDVGLANWTGGFAWRTKLQNYAANANAYVAPRWLNQAYLA